MYVRTYFYAGTHVCWFACTYAYIYVYLYMLTACKQYYLEPLPIEPYEAPEPRKWVPPRALMHRASVIGGTSQTCVEEKRSVLTTHGVIM